MPLVEDNDPLLRPLIEAESEEARRDAVERLIVDHVRPVVTVVLARHARSDQGIEVDDLESSVVLRIIERLQQVPFDESAAIASVRDFAATVAFNATHDVLRRLAPSRARLKSRVRHALTRHPRLATWKVCFLFSPQWSFVRWSLPTTPTPPRSLGGITSG